MLLLGGLKVRVPENIIKMINKTLTETKAAARLQQEIKETVV